MRINSISLFPGGDVVSIVSTTPTNCSATGETSLYQRAETFRWDLMEWTSRQQISTQHYRCSPPLVPPQVLSHVLPLSPNLNLDYSEECKKSESETNDDTDGWFIPPKTKVSRWYMTHRSCGGFYYSILNDNWCFLSETCFHDRWNSGFLLITVGD